MTATNSEYIPGVCNIGRAEVRQRWIAGWIGVVASVLLLAILVLFKTAVAWRLSVFFPATLAAVGFLQAAWHFCAKFGLGGVFNFGPQIGKTDTVEQAEFRKKDRRTALLIIGLSLLIALAVAAAAYFIPL